MMVMEVAKFTIISFGILNLLVVFSAASKKNFCTTTECIHASAFMLERINVDIDPCDNFYDFACGAFLDSTSLPDERVGVDTFSLWRDNIDQQLNSYAENRRGDGKLDKLTHELYHACIQRNEVNNFNHDGDTLKELREIIERLGGWPLLDDKVAWNDSKWSLEATIEDIRKHLLNRTDEIFNITSFIIHIQHANNPSLRPTQSYSSLREAYRQYIRQTASILGNIPVRMQEIDDLLNFEHRLNELNYRLSKQSKILHHGEEIIKKFLHIQWLDYFHPSPLRDFKIEEIDKIESMSVLNEMRNLLNSTSKRTQANFLIWRVIDYAANQIESPLKIYKFQFQSITTGQLDREQIWKECINVVKHELPYAIGYNFIKSDSFKLKSSSLMIFNNIKDGFTALIEQAKWIDDSIREKLLNKLKALTPLIAYPGDGFSETEISAFYSELSIDTNQYLRTLFALRIIDADNKFRRTYATAASSDIDNWRKYLPPTSLIAVYSNSDNTLRISYSILMNIINAEKSLKYLNFGSVGFIIAHEMSHIFDQFFDSLSTSVEFTAKKRCIVEQYNSYQDPETMQFLDGKRTLSENIADLTGITLATNAHKLWQSQFNDTRYSLIGIDFTPNQLFWIATAQLWCAVYREEETKRKIKNDIYATERFRVTGMLENAPDFSNDFQCSKSSRMNRHENKCDIW